MVQGLIAAGIGGLLAVLTGFGVVSSQTKTPPVANAEYIVYGNS